MNENNNVTVAFDGHDGAGKTTLAKLLVSEIDGVFVRPFANNNGVSLIDAFEKGDNNFTMQLGRSLIQDVYNNHSKKTLVFDRHWMTVLSLIDEKYWANWSYFPQTILCWADLKTTKERLNIRAERKYDESYHKYYLGIYKKLAEKFNILVIDTSNMSTPHCLNKIISWVNDKKIKL